MLRIQLPALRDRQADIPLLVSHFCLQAARQLQNTPKSLSPALLERMQAYSWPGNVRELENTCWRLVSSTSHECLDAADWIQKPSALTLPQENLSAWQQQLGALALQRLQQGDSAIHAGFKAQFEQSLLEAALQFSGGHRQQAAQLLGLGRNTVTRKLGSGRKPKDEP